MSGELKIRILEDTDLSGVIQLDEKIGGAYRPEVWERRITYYQRRDPEAPVVAEADGKVVGFMFGEVRSGEFGLEEPTGIVVECQNERSQAQNKAQAMNVLHAKLQALMEQQHAEKVSDLRGEVKEAAWGNQIRSYVLHPYKQIKDHRTNTESKNPEAVLDGNLDLFLDVV